MKTFLFICCSFMIIRQLPAQEAGLITFTKMEQAKAFATEHNQDILMVFAGSDWCKPCIQFKENILQSTDFDIQMEDKVTVLYLDFPARRKNKLSKEQTAHNEALAERFNKSGAFPKIVLVDRQENILAQPTFKGQTALDFAHTLKANLSTINSK